MYLVKFTTRALKALNKLPKEIRLKIIGSLDLLKVNPHAEIIQIKKLRNRNNLFRIRVGNYRIIYELHTNIITIIVIRIGHRKDVYQYLKDN